MVGDVCVAPSGEACERSAVVRAGQTRRVLPLRVAHPRRRAPLAAVPGLTAEFHFGTAPERFGQSRRRAFIVPHRVRAGSS